MNSALLKSWLPKRPVGRLLKTDLFDESLGNGLCSIMASKATHVFGMDISIQTLRNAKSRHRELCATCSDVRHLPFSSGSFDVIVSNSTLDHFDSTKEIEASLQELRRVLRSDGNLVLTLDNLANPLITLRQSLPFHTLHQAGIVPYFVGSTYTPLGLRRVLERVGFTISDMRAIMHCPRVAAVFIAGILEKRASRSLQAKFSRYLLAFERFANLPTRYITGHFIAVCVKKGLA